MLKSMRKKVRRFNICPIEISEKRRPNSGKAKLKNVMAKIKKYVF